MSVPICKVCKKAHWPREAHRWDAAADGKVDGKVDGKKVLMRQIDCEKYNAYMREYMRAYRAKRTAEALNG